MNRRAITAALIAPLLLPVSARALDFDYIKIADFSTVVPDGGTTPFGLFQAPGISGYSVAFRGNKASVGGGSLGKDALYISSGGVLTQIVSSTTTIPAGSGTFIAYDNPSLSGGSLAFTGYNGSAVPGIYSNVGGLNRVADVNTPVPGGSGNFTSFGGATTLDGGNILFYGLSGGSQRGFYSTAGGLHAVANTNTPIPGGSGNFITLFDGASLNGGNIAFTSGGSSGQQGIYSDVGGTLHAVADKNTLTPQAAVTFSSFGAAPSLSGGNVAFYATSSAQADGIYTDIGGLNVVADHSTPVPGGTGNFTSMGTVPSLSNGSVAFNGTGGGLSGVFTNYGWTLSAVVTNAMFLDGKKVTSFPPTISPRANSNGNVAFLATFQDNTQGMYVAEQSYDYATGASGAWDTASNWSFGLKPRTVVSTNIHPSNGAVITGPVAATTIRGLDLGATSSGQAELRLQASGQLTVNEYMYVEPLGKLNLNGGVATAVFGAYNYGEIDLAGGQLTGGFLANSGTLHGGGTVGSYLINYATIQAVNASMHFTNQVDNDKDIQVINSQITADGIVTNFRSPSDGVLGSIDVRNGFLQFNGGFKNFGQLNFTFGTSDVFGSINNVAGFTESNTPGGQIIVSGNSNVTFYGPIVHHGDVFRVSPGSTAVFFGPVSGAGAFTGGGTKIFEGGYSPGNSPAAVSLDGPVQFGETNTLKIELGGTMPGTQFDQVHVNGQLALAGTLNVLLINGFQPVAGNLFHILDSSSLSGAFSTLDLSTMNGRIVWDSSHLYDSGALGGTLSVVATYYAGDFNRDGLLTAADVPAMLQALTDLNAYKTAKGLTDVQLQLIGDLDGAGAVNNKDIQPLLDLIANQAGAGSVAAVPEPGCAALAAIGLVVFGGFFAFNRKFA